MDIWGEKDNPEWTSRREGEWVDLGEKESLSGHLGEQESQEWTSGESRVWVDI